MESGWIKTTALEFRSQGCEGVFRILSGARRQLFPNELKSTMAPTSCRRGTMSRLLPAVGLILAKG